MVYIEELKDAVYEADDVFDEFLTLAHQKKLTKGIKVRLFSLFTKLGVAFRMSQKVDKIKKKLDDIAYNNQLISFRHDPEPIKKRSRETCSYVHSVDIIGRDDDLEEIVSVLLDADVQRDVSFLSIVGIGGLGKTALAQLLFNDPRVKSAFSLRAWTCVSDQDQQELDIKGIFGKILESTTGTWHRDASLELLQSQLRKELFKEKYLIVLDDVWTENRDQWKKLVEFLKESQKGSWVVVTTRSWETARIIGDGHMHLLQGLSNKDSWRLFATVAFESEQSNPPEDLVNIGQKIVERCTNVPLAIKVTGSLLYGQDKHKWQSFQELGLTKFDENKNGIMPILKLSYHQLESPLKSCFGYCALFPKDYQIEKKTLMRLWIAQGYIHSCDERCMEDIAEEYFLVLLRRCFFQDVWVDEFGDVKSCKVHDLMHDVAQEVVGKEICTGDAVIDTVDKKVRHYSHTSTSKFMDFPFTKTCIRSFLYIGPEYVAGRMNELSTENLLSNWKYLRALDLSNLGIYCLPSSIGKLLHLRYLDLSYNVILEMLPKQITKLYNLQTLVLRGCRSLKELPKDLSQLAKLRILDIKGCEKLTYMPIGMGKLDCLVELTLFVVENYMNGLEDLKTLKNLKGRLEIKIGLWKKGGYVEIEDRRDRGCLSNKGRLTFLKLCFSEVKDEGRMQNDEAVIEELEPHSNLKRLEMEHYRGVRMPKWAREDTFANLVKLALRRCPNLESLGCLGTLHSLKFLYLDKLCDLECLIENNDTKGDVSGRRVASVVVRARLSSAEEVSFFPSLEQLSLQELPKMKGWQRGVGMRDDDQLLRFPKLKTLHICNCPNLTAIVECPILEALTLINFNKKLKIMRKIKSKEKGDEKEQLGEAALSGIPCISASSDHIPRLGRVAIDDIKWLNSQNLEAFQCIRSLVIMSKEAMGLGECRELFLTCASSLRSLTLTDCRNLRSVSGGLEHLTALETLAIDSCPLSEEERLLEWHDMEVPSLPSLRTLKISQLANLPPVGYNT